jgi:hypothetical protein
MPQACTVCSNPDAVLINEALVLYKQSNRSIAQQYNVHHSAVQRHREHIPELLVKASLAQEVADADLLLEKLQGLEDDARVALEATRSKEEWRTYLAAISEIREQIKLLAQVSGKLAEVQINTQVNVALTAHPDYRKYEDAIALALADYPEARWAVAEALEGIE